jgi:hypothetical protein
MKAIRVLVAGAAAIAASAALVLPAGAASRVVGHVSVTVPAQNGARLWHATYHSGTRLDLTTVMTAAGPKPSIGNVVFRMTQTKKGQPGYTHWVDISVAAPKSSPLVRGLYQNATRFGEDNTARLDFDWDGRGCNAVSGLFRVTKIQYGAYGHISSLHLEFRAMCDATRVVGRFVFDERH